MSHEVGMMAINTEVEGDMVGCTVAIKWCASDDRSAGHMADTRHLA